MTTPIKTVADFRLKSNLTPGSEQLTNPHVLALANGQLDDVTHPTLAASDFLIV